MAVKAQERPGDRSKVSPPSIWSNAPDVSDETVRTLVADMNRAGVAVLPNYVEAGDLRSLQDFVQSAVDKANGEYVVFNGKHEVTGTLLESLANTPQFERLMHRVYELGAGKPAPTQSLYQVLRCLKGNTGVKQALIFHFDSYVVTALVPIIIPNKGRKGHLVMAPNLRKERAFYFINLIDKVLLDNKITQSILRFTFNSGILKLKRVEMIPGNLYLFWGYRSLHTNEACDIENIRATALYHFGDPHAGSALRQKMGRAVV